MKYLCTGHENVNKIQGKLSGFFGTVKTKKKKRKQHSGNSLPVIYLWQHLAATVFPKMKGA